MKDVILYEMSFAKDFLNSLCFVSGLNLSEEKNIYKKQHYNQTLYCKMSPLKTTEISQYLTLS